mgnify:FL=1
MPEFLNITNLYLYVGAFATVLYILKLIIYLFTGGDAEVHADFDSLTDVDTSFNFLSVQSILAFLMGFGWVGLASIVQFKTSVILSVVLAVIIGLIFMFLSAYLMFLIKKLDKRVQINLDDFVGTVGRAYTAFKPNAEGQIEITLNEQLSVLSAVNLSDEEINAFMPVKIAKVEDNKIYIIKI